MVKFSAPEEKAVKAVLTAKNHKLGLKIFSGFGCLLLATIIYGIVSVFTNKFWTVRELFSDNLFTGMVCFCIATLFSGIFFVNRPVTKKQLFDNGRYQVILDDNQIKVIFPDEPEIVVPLSQITSVEEYDIFYLIRCFKNTDEIVCSKNAFLQGNDEEFKKYFSDNGFETKVKEHKIYTSLLKKIDKNVRAGYASLIYAGLAIVLAFPFYWLVIEVLITFVPSLVEVMMVTLLDIPLWTAIIISVLYIPIVLTSTLVCGVSAFGLLAFIPFLIYLSGYYSYSQIKTKKWKMAFVSAIGVILAIFALVFCLLLLLHVFYI